jgi:uncharacterized protein (TIGR03067 family)
MEQHGGKPSRLGMAVFFMVDGKRACWQASDREMQGGVYLDPTGKPKTYDFVTSERTVEGIYSLEGDTLRLCYDMGSESKRPGQFITKKGTQQVLIVLKRIHGPEVFPFRLADGTRAFPQLIEKGEKSPPPQTAPTPRDSGPGPYKMPTEKDRHSNVKEEPTGKVLPGTSTFKERETKLQGTPTTVIVQNAKIVIAPGERIRLKPVKTASGGRVRLEMGGITIEVPRLTIQSEGKTTQIEATETGDTLTSRSFSGSEDK